MSKIIFCYTVPETFRFSVKSIELLRSFGHEIILVSSNENNNLNQLTEKLKVIGESIALTRSFSIFNDLKSLIYFIQIIKKHKPDMVVGATPKAALISMLASFLCSVRHRIYHIFGLPYESSRGLKKIILKNIEFITSILSTEIIPISHSVYKEYIDNIPFVKGKIAYFYPLTVGGVNIEKFNPNNFTTQKLLLRNKLCVPENHIIIGFIGRLSVDKGVYDFIKMINELKKRYDNIMALLIGEIDSRNPIDKDKLEEFLSQSNTICIEWSSNIELYFSIIDIFVLPSYREGFGNVNIEASSMEIPIISYNVTGCKDSVKNNISGFLIEKGNINQLISASSILIENKELRSKIGKQGRQFVKETFTEDIVAANYVSHIIEILTNTRK